MKRRVLSLLLGLLLLLLAAALVARGARPVGAGPLPTIGTPAAAHVQLDGSFTSVAPAPEGAKTLTIAGAGDYDQSRRALRFEAALTAPAQVAGGGPERSAFAVVLADGRLYWREPDGAGWTWVEAPDGANTSFGLASGDRGSLALDGLTFVRVGPEMIAGAATTHWRADLDFDALLGAAGLGTPVAGGSPPPMTLAVDLWIGDADTFIHRLALKLALGATDERGRATTIAAEVALTFSRFDQPVTIVAPQGARPAEVPLATALPGTVQTFTGLDIAALPLASFGLDAGDLGVAAGGRGAASNRGGVGPSPSPGRSAARIVVTGPTPAAGGATPISAPTKAPTATRPAPIPSVAAKVIDTGAAVQPTALALGALQVAPQVATQSRSALPLPLAAAAVGALLVAAVGLVLVGRRRAS